MKKYKDQLKESKKYNSDFDGYIIEHVPYRVVKSVERILKNYEIVYDIVRDLTYYQIITELDETDINLFNTIVKEIEEYSGFKIYNYKLNR
jgi:hypothetical protein